MSRATLVRRFQDTVGVAPMTYVANWRLTKAHNLIKYSAAPLEQIADTVGFASARTLSRAFSAILAARRMRYGTGEMSSAVSLVLAHV